MNLEELHVAQLYETVLWVAVLTLLVVQGLITWFKLWGHVTSIRTKELE